MIVVDGNVGHVHEVTVADRHAVEEIDLRRVGPTMGVAGAALLGGSAPGMARTPTTKRMSTHSPSRR